MKPRYPVLLACAVLGAPVSAHHSNTMFDNAAELTLSGTVREFQWSNPHAYVQLLVTNAQGATEEWSVEMAAPMYLYNLGWRPSTLKEGDKVTAVVWPLRNGEKGGLAQNVLDGNGAPIGRKP